MSNPLFNQFGNQPNQNGGYGLLCQIAKTVQNPQQRVQELLNSGQMTQEQFQQYAQMANTIMGKR